MAAKITEELTGNSNPVTFLVGENGSGKSRRLAELVDEAVSSGRHSIAISNTSFDRFPKYRKRGYFKLTPSIGKRYAEQAFKQAILSGEHETLRNTSLIAKVLEYTGFNPIFGLHVRIPSNVSYTQIESAIDGVIPERDIPVVRKAFDIYRNYGSRRQSAWVQLYGSPFGPDRSELFVLLKYEAELKRARLIQSVSITLERGSSIFELNQASSGELSLLASHAYIATHIAEQSVIFIDEPENSLHPKWQGDYCKKLLDQFYYYEPKLIIATHSPHVVQGAEYSEVGVSLMKPPFSKVVPQPVTKSIEGTLLEVFGVLSPESHYLSEKVARLLNDVIHQRKALSDVQSELRQLEQLSSDRAQREFLETSISLSSQVVETLRKRG